MSAPRRLFHALPLIFALALVAARPASAAEPLRISGWTKPFSLPVMVEIARGTYKDAFPEFDVSIVEMRSGPALMAAVESGEADVVQGIGDAAFLVSASAGIGAKIFAVNSRSPKGFAVMSGNPKVKKIKDLKGRKVAGLRGSVAHQIFVGALAENGMTEADVEFFPMPPTNAASALLAGYTDAALLAGGDIRRALDAGAVVLADGEGRVRGLSLAVAGTSFLRKHPGFIKKFLAMRRATLAYIAENPAEALTIAAERMKQDAKAVKPMMPLYDFACDLTDEDAASMEETVKYLTGIGALRSEVDIKSLLAK